MSTENVELVQRGFKAFKEGDLEFIMQFIDPRFEIIDRVLPEGGLTERGLDALIANAARVREVFGDVTWEPREIVDAGDRVLVRVHVEATADHTALPVNEDVGHVYTIEDGKAIGLDIFRTWKEAQEFASST